MHDCYYTKLFNVYVNSDYCFFASESFLGPGKGRIFKEVGEPCTGMSCMTKYRHTIFILSMLFYTVRLFTYFLNIRLGFNTV